MENLLVIPGLLVDLIDSVGVILGVEVVEAEVLVAKAESVKLPHPLLHDAKGRVQPSNVHSGSLLQTSGLQQAGTES